MKYLFLILALCPLLHAQDAPMLNLRADMQKYAVHPRVVTPGFVALNGTAFAAAFTDVYMSQQAFKSGQAHEGNPAQKCAALCQYLIAGSSATGGMIFDIEAIKHGHRKAGAIGPIMVIGEHAVGIGFAARF